MRTRTTCLGVIGVLLGVCGTASAQWADAYGPQPSYYSTATSTDGPTLKTQLRSKISIATVRSYDYARDVLGFIDQDPNNPGNCILIYNGASVQGPWSSGGVIWNREHTWPQSKGASSGPLNSDLHHLRPCNGSINSSRGNKNFGLGGSYWDPNSQGGVDRGEIARTCFYTDTRYTHVTLVDGNPGGSNQVGDKATLLRWHYDEMPETRERRRNDIIDDLHQNNRNPYIDHPEFVWAVYGAGPNNSQLHLGSPDADGGSVLVVDFGRTIGDPGPLQTDVTLFKGGTHPTTFYTNAAGDAMVTNVLPHDGMGYTTTSRQVHVELVAGATPGMYAGEVVFDNTDITSSGLGHGSEDADDTVLLFADVLDHAEASFDQLVDQDTLVIELGNVPDNAGPVQVPVRVYALGGDKADLDIDSVATVFASPSFDLDATTPASVIAGSFAEFTLTLDPSVGSGPVAGQYLVFVSDEDIAGAQTGATLTLSVIATIVPGADPADWNMDGSVNDQDFFDFVNDYFAHAGPQGMADFNGDGFENDQDWFDFVNAYF